MTAGSGPAGGERKGCPLTMLMVIGVIALVVTALCFV
jgi:hypothetical protein